MTRIFYKHHQWLSLCLSPGFRGHPVTSCDVALAFVECMRYGKLAKNSEILGPYMPVPTYKLRCLCSTNATKIGCGPMMDYLDGILLSGVVKNFNVAIGKNIS